MQNELIQFIKTNFPQNTTEIRESLELLEYSIESLLDSVLDKSNQIGKGMNRDLDEAIRYMERAKEIKDMSKLIVDFIGKLDIEDYFGLNEIENVEESENIKTLPNYAKYTVDSDIAHNIYEDYTHKRPFAFELKGTKVLVKDWKEILLEVYEMLISFDKNIFKTFPDNEKMNGRKSPYFAYDESKIIRDARKLKGLEIYVESNFNANGVRNIIADALREYKIPLSEFKIYLRADYSALHE